MNINLRIERIILEGLPIAPVQRHLVQAALEAELTRLIGENGLQSSFLSNGAWPSINAANLNLSDQSNPTQLGQQIARSVYGGIGRE